MRLYLDSCVLIDALDGAEQLRRHTLQQLERYADVDWVISDLVCMECLVGPLRSADQSRPLALQLLLRLLRGASATRRGWSGPRAGSAGIFFRVNCFLAVDCLFLKNPC